MPQPRGLGFVMKSKVDADHAADTTAIRSRTVFLIYLNCYNLYWFYKKQTSVGKEICLIVMSIEI